MKALLIWLDVFFILPYRLVDEPVAAYLLGTAALALLAAVMGVCTLNLALRLYGKRLEKYQNDMQHYNALGETALQGGSKETFKVVNRQGHEAFGYYFSLSGALFVASLWPVPLILAWMQLRFGETSPVLPFSLPLFGNKPGMVFWFLILYIPLRMLCTRVWRRLRRSRPAPELRAPQA